MTTSPLRDNLELDWEQYSVIRATCRILMTNDRCFSSCPWKDNDIKLGFRKPSRWENVDLMELIPEKACESITDPTSGSVKLLMPRYDRWPYNRLIQPWLSQEKKFIKIPLEDRGSFLWGQIDGRRTIGDLVPGFVKKFPDDSADAPKRLGAYLYQMYENKFVCFPNLPK